MSSTPYKFYVQTRTGTVESTITNQAAAVDEWILEIRSSCRNRPVVVGLKTKWSRQISPDYMNSSSVDCNRLALCVGNKCLIFQVLWKDEIPPSLRDFLMDPNFTFVGVGIDGDLAVLREECQLHCARFVDLGSVAMRRWPERWSQQPGLKDLSWQISGLEIEEESNNINTWRLRNLSEKQIINACLDAFASYKIGFELQVDF